MKSDFIDGQPLSEGAVLELTVGGEKAGGFDFDCHRQMQGSGPSRLLGYSTNEGRTNSSCMNVGVNSPRQPWLAATGLLFNRR